MVEAVFKDEHKAADETGSSVFIDDVYRVTHPAQIQPNAAMQS